MKLYHGSNQKVVHPEIILSRRQLDFGSAFYLTSDLEQAKKWAIRTTKSRVSGIATVSVYDFDEKALASLNVKKFDGPDKNWLNYISANRKGDQPETGEDIVIGAVANDQTVRVLNQYLRGYFPVDVAIRLLLPQKLKDQYAFKSEQAIKYLHFTEEIIL